MDELLDAVKLGEEFRGKPPFPELSKEEIEMRNNYLKNQVPNKIKFNFLI